MSTKIQVFQFQDPNYFVLSNRKKKSYHKNQISQWFSPSNAIMNKSCKQGLPFAILSQLSDFQDINGGGSVAESSFRKAFSEHRPETPPHIHTTHSVLHIYRLCISKNTVPESAS